MDRETSDVENELHEATEEVGILTVNKQESDCARAEGFGYCWDWCPGELGVGVGQKVSPGDQSSMKSAGCSQKKQRLSGNAGTRTVPAETRARRR